MGYRVEDFAADVVRLFDALDVERAVLAGHSGACLVARRVSLDHPARVAGLLLEASPTTLRDDARLLRFVESVVSELDDPISPDFARSFVVDTSSANVAPDLVDVLVEDILAVPARVWKQTFAGLLEYDDRTSSHSSTRRRSWSGATPTPWSHKRCRTNWQAQSPMPSPSSTPALGTLPGGTTRCASATTS